ncbi:MULTISPECIES: exodeoxyribonuclease V subunit alpha [Methylococcus]|uniref:RecBCD enzyme subunit RecD n=1 Tax=Methylococcus capsulatus TaxID=414 RepID=A0ABZ2F1V1_METCP|nr:MULTISPECIES: exodeoxyribonuclease V subunit alpha [Methylococcus]MDF9391409.1 exodeoxyribonuclease V subunit alpha [Methylococcus capsulatus]
MIAGESKHSSQHLLASGFARRCLRWANNPAESEVLERAAFLASFATTEGHVCTDLAELAEDFPQHGPESLRTLLLGSGVVGAPQGEPRPLVLDDEGRLYLYRYFDYERRLASALRRLARGRDRLAPPSEAVQEQLNALFPATAGGGPDWQKLAAALALLGRLTVISGGPGTGKTTTVVNLLAYLIVQNPDCRIALAAPTGKAAARMLDALRERAAHLPGFVRAKLPDAASTVHRLLGVIPGSGNFRHHAGNPLAVDVLVVDEASMLDLSLATKLVEAMPVSGRLVLLGDKDQLAAVEAGAVFAELSADPRLSPPVIEQLAALTQTDPAAIVTAAPVRPTPLEDCVVWFSRNYRFRSDSGIGRLAARVNSGEADAVIAELRTGGEDGVIWREAAAAAPDAGLIETLLAGYADYLNVMHSGDAAPEAAFAAYNRFRILCAVRDSPRGVDAINRLIAREWRRRLGLGADPRAEWYPGRPVMVLHNDYVLKLFNGDIGLVLAAPSGELRVHFPDAGGGFRAIPPSRLPEHETAFALTVHKSQGSEFDEVALLLPDRVSPVLTRELIYTGITRGKRTVSLIGAAPVLAEAIRRRTRRYSGLIARLKEIP